MLLARFSDLIIFFSVTGATGLIMMINELSDSWSKKYFSHFFSRLSFIKNTVAIIFPTVTND